MTNIVIAKRSGMLRAPNGERFRLAKGVTLADARHPAVVAFPEDWRPVDVALSVNDAADSDVPAAEITEDELAELRTELAEAHETVDHLGAQFRRLIEGLVARDVELPEDEAREQGWLVGLVLDTLDATAAKPVADEPVEQSVAERLADRKAEPAPEPGTVIETDPERPTLGEGTTIALPEEAPADVVQPPRRPRKATARPKPKTDDDA